MQRFLALNQRPIAWLFVLFFTLYGLTGGVQNLLWLLALAGFISLIRDRGRWLNRPGPIVWWMLLGCVLLPSFLSMLVAIDPARSARTIFRLLAYGFAARWLFELTPTLKQWDRTTLALYGVVLLFVADGFVQAITGYSISGAEPSFDVSVGYKITSSMGVTYGDTLAILSPLMFEAIRLHGRRLPLLWLGVPALAAAIIMSASPGATLTVLISGVLYVLMFVPSPSRRTWLLSALLGVAVVLSGVAIPLLVLGHLTDWSETAGKVISTDWITFSTALSYRPELWWAASQVFLDSPLLGVGVRGAHEAMLPYLEQSPLWVYLPPMKFFYPHWILAEVAVSLGLIGLVFYAILIWQILRLMRRECYPAGVMALVALLAFFPFSVSLSFFSYRATLLGWPALAFAIGMVLRARQETPVVTGNPRHILLLAVGHLGDVVAATGLASALQKAYPGIQVSWLTTPGGAALVRHHSSTARVLNFRGEEWRSNRQQARYSALLKKALALRSQLRSSPVDIAIDLTGSRVSSAAAWLSGAPVRIAAREDAQAGYFLTHLAQEAMATSERNVNDPTSALVNALGVDRDDMVPDIVLGDRDLFSGVGELEKGKYAVICPFADSPSQCWTENHWFGLAELIDRQFGYRILMLGTATDLVTAKRLAANSVIENRVGQLSMGENAALLARAEFVVSVDNGMVELAMAFNTPLVALLGSNRPRVSVERSNVCVLVDTDTSDAVPAKGMPSSYSGKNLPDVDPAEVMEAIRGLRGIDTKR